MSCIHLIRIAQDKLKLDPTFNFIIGKRIGHLHHKKNGCNAQFSFCYLPFQNHSDFQLLLRLRVRQSALYFFASLDVLT